jgi:hypothetical protein
MFSPSDETLEGVSAAASKMDVRLTVALGKNN